MRLSDAIRLGSLIRPKANGYFFFAGASCAQGAALEATGTVYDENASDDHHDQMADRWPWAEDEWVTCPECGNTRTVVGMIAHLNNQGHYTNDHDWTREQIADQVEIWEQATAEPASLAAVDPEVLTEVQRA